MEVLKPFVRRFKYKLGPLMVNTIPILFIILSLNFSASVDTYEAILTETQKINDIDFTFEMKGNYFQYDGEFELNAKIACSESTSFDFEHKKKYTSGADEFILSEMGEDWYEVTFVIRKYFMTEVRALYLYQLDAEQNMIEFELISSQINIPSLNVVEASNGKLFFRI